MSAPVRVSKENLVKLNEIRGLLTVQRKAPVAIGEAVDWIFKQLPEDYLEKLKDEVLNVKEALRLKIGLGTPEEAMAAFEELMELHMNEDAGGEI